jgi:F0F1-type ATP synthase assembly protein I
MDGDTIAIVERVTFRDTIIQVRTINPKSRHDVRIEKRKLKHVEKIAKTDVKVAREKTKQAKHENRTYKGLLSSLVLGIIIGIMIGTRIPRFWLVKK